MFEVEFSIIFNSLKDFSKHPKENHQLIIKIISDVESSKNVSFGLVTKIVSSLTLFFALIPNIIYTI
jgi:hypothetical protein